MLSFNQSWQLLTSGFTLRKDERWCSRWKAIFGCRIQIFKLLSISCIRVEESKARLYIGCWLRFKHQELHHRIELSERRCWSTRNQEGLALHFVRNYQEEDSRFFIFKNWRCNINRQIWWQESFFSLSKVLDDNPVHRRCQQENLPGVAT